MCLLKDHVKASYPLIWVTTLEPHRFIQSEVKELSEMDKKCFIWDISEGLKTLNHEGDRIECDPNEVLQQIKAGVDDGVYFLSYYGHFLKSPVNGEVDIVNIQTMVNLIPYLKTKRCMVVVVSPSLSLPDELEREFTVLEHTMPNVEALGEIVKHIVNDNGLPQPSAEELEKITFAGKGLTVGEFEDVSALSLVRTKKFCPLTIAEQKAQMVKKTSGLQITKFKETFADLGGYENLKTWTLNRFHRRKLKLGSESLPFRGILLLGVPGAGKTLFGKALGHEVGWPCVILNLGELFGSLVGQSEERARRVFATIDAMAPTIVFVD